MVPEGAAGWRYSWDRYLFGALLAGALAWLVATGAGKELWRGYWAQRHLQMGKDALANADLERAETEFQAARNLAPARVEADAQIALLYLEAQMPEAALPYTRAAVASCRDALLIALLGDVWLRLGHEKEAQTAFDRALLLQPQNPDVLNVVGYSYAVAGKRLEYAESLLKQALAGRPRAPEIVDSLGWVYFKMGRYAEAVRLLERAARGMPNHPEIVGHLRLARRALREEQARQRQAQPNGADG